MRQLARVLAITWLSTGLCSAALAQEAQPTIGSVSGRLVDAVTGEALGNDTVFSAVDLYACDLISCRLLATQFPDALGEFRFEPDPDSGGIRAGSFAILVSADNYGIEVVDFSVGEGEDFDLGDVALSPPAIQLSDLVPCTSLLPQGGVCEYSVRIRNNTSERLRGTARSLVFDVVTQNLFEASTRPTGTVVQRAAVTIPARSTRDVTFYFNAPSFLPFGTTLCTDLTLGLEPSPLFNIVHVEGLFCVTKSVFGLRVMGTQESRSALLRSSRMNPAQLLRRRTPLPVLPD